MPLSCKKVDSLVKVHVSWIDVNDRKYVDINDLLLLLHRAKVNNISTDAVITFFETLQSK